MSYMVKAIKANLNLSENRPIKELVYEAVRKTVILGDILSGERINEKNLAAGLNISRTPLRYAFTRLADEGLVVRKPGVGVIVKGMTLRDAREIFDIRKELDTLATCKAMERMSSAQYAALERLLQDTQRLDQTGEVDAVIQHFSDFNAFIYQASQMPLLESILTKLRAYLVYFRDISIRSKGRRDRAIREHWLIYRGMVNHDPEQIRMLIHEHLDYSLQFILNEMRARDLE